MWYSRGEKALLEADVTGDGHATQQRKGEGDDAEGDGQADTHQGVVARPELRDGGAGRREPDEREDGRPVRDAGGHHGGGQQGDGRFQQDHLGQHADRGSAHRSRVNGRLRSTSPPPTATARLQPATISVRATAAYTIFSSVAARPSRI